MSLAESVIETCPVDATMDADDVSLDDVETAMNNGIYAATDATASSVVASSVNTYVVDPIKLATALDVEAFNAATDAENAEKLEVASSVATLSTPRDCM
jgi:hypothetical protein